MNEFACTGDGGRMGGGGKRDDTEVETSMATSALSVRYCRLKLSPLLLFYFDGLINECTIRSHNYAETVQTQR